MLDLPEISDDIVNRIHEALIRPSEYQMGRWVP